MLIRHLCLHSDFGTYMNNEMKLPCLMKLSLSPIRTWFERKAIQAEIKREYMYYDFFEWQEKNGSTGKADSLKRIVNLEAQLRDL